jgi:hypothetical protein
MFNETPMPVNDAPGLPLITPIEVYKIQLIGKSWENLEIFKNFVKAVEQPKGNHKRKILNAVLKENYQQFSTNVYFDNNDRTLF